MLVRKTLEEHPEQPTFQTVKVTPTRVPPASKNYQNFPATDQASPDQVPARQRQVPSTLAARCPH